jgi:hypothetical protein
VSTNANAGHPSAIPTSSSCEIHVAVPGSPVSAPRRNQDITVTVWPSMLRRERRDIRFGVEKRSVIQHLLLAGQLH